MWHGPGAKPAETVTLGGKSVTLRPELSPWPVKTVTLRPEPSGGLPRHPQWEADTAAFAC
jgi:hypothetical protein